jgi:hypothetical protein
LVNTRHFIRPLLVVAAGVFAASAQAVPISYSFSGTLESMGWSNGTPIPFGGEIPLGLTISGSFTLDVDAADNQSTDPARLFVRPRSATFQMSIEDFAPLPSFSSGGGSCESSSYLAIADDNPNAGFPPQPGRVTDQWAASLWCTEQTAPGVEVTRTMLFEFNDWNPTGSPDLVNGLDPAQLFDRTLATTSLISFGYLLTDANCTTCMYGVAETWNLGVRLESLVPTTASVPEPATAMLLMLGLTGCWVARRQRA